ncbi:hypothetical protein Taro_011099 [Colocasia esculenta]|uniref:Uncharacterized protein n=1 Tax=Colocasia esculenta TaxID=4460 RepID=A0A843U4X5_COLES|nr:hypothetical protein [Colocasia esculenta]
MYIVDVMDVPWLREVGVAEHRPVRTSRDVMSGRSSRPRHRQVLYFPPPPPVDYEVFMHGLVQAMQTQAHTQAALKAQLEAQAGGRDGAISGGKEGFVEEASSDIPAARQEENGAVGDVAPLEETVETDSERRD